MIKLTIIIPVYNVEKYIVFCLDSIYESQKLNENEFEVLIIDDGSPDNSYTIADNYAKKHNNIKVIRQQNKGLGGARNTGIENAKGLYIIFLDSDDYYLENTLEKLLVKAIDLNVDVLEFGARGVDENGHVIYEKKYEDLTVLSGVEYYFKVDCMNSACNKIYSRNFLLSNNLLFLERVYIEDFEFNTRVFLAAKTITSTSLNAVCFLQNTFSITRNTDIKKRQKMYSDIIKIIERTKFLCDFCNDENSLNLVHERLTFLNVTLFYQLFKDRRGLSTYKDIKRKLENEGLLYLDGTIKDKRKNYFRVFIKWLFKICF